MEQPNDKSVVPTDAPWWARWLAAVGKKAASGLVDNWRSAWKFATTNWSVLCGIAAEAYAQYPDQINAYLQFMQHKWPHAVSAAFFGIALLRLVDFKKFLSPKAPPSTDK